MATLVVSFFFIFFSLVHFVVVSVVVVVVSGKVVVELAAAGGDAAVGEVLGGGGLAEGFDAGLVVDAEAEFDLAGSEAGPFRGGTAGEVALAVGGAHGRGAACRGAGGPCDVREAGPLVREGAGDLVDDDGAPDAPWPRRVRYGGVVRDVDRFDGDAVASGDDAGGDAEVEAVPRVVLHHQQAARGLGGHRRDGAGDGLGRRTREDVAADRRRQQAFPDEARVGRLVAGPPAGDHRDLPRSLDRRLEVATDHNPHRRREARVVETTEVFRIDLHQALHDALRQRRTAVRVQDLLHRRRPLHGRRPVTRRQ